MLHPQEAILLHFKFAELIYSMHNLITFYENPHVTVVKYLHHHATQRYTHSSELWEKNPQEWTVGMNKFYSLCARILSL